MVRGTGVTWRRALLLALACVWLAMLLLGGGPLDRAIYLALYSGARPALVIAARLFTAIGEPTVVLALGLIVAAWLWFRRSHRFALAFAALVLVGRALTEAQKYWVARARPELEPHLVVVKTSSFPSGHAANSMIFYLALAVVIAPKAWRRIAAAAAVLLSLLVGLSRVMLGVHWPSDVIGGWSFGALWVFLTFPVTERLYLTDSQSAAKQL